MKNPEKILKKIRKAEAELVGASPARAAKLTGIIVRLKVETLGDERP